MARIRTASPRMSMLNQLALSITGTVAATLIVTGIQRELTGRPPESVRADMTSGGKFSARVQALRAEADEAAPAIPAPRVPVLVADAAFHAVPPSFAESPPPAAATSRTADAAPRPARRPTRIDPHRITAAAIDVVPPKRSENVAAETPSPSASSDESLPSALWSSTKGLYKQAVWAGGEALDRVNPMKLLN